MNQQGTRRAAHWEQEIGELFFQMAADSAQEHLKEELSQSSQQRTTEELAAAERSYQAIEQRVKRLLYKQSDQWKGSRADTKKTIRFGVVAAVFAMVMILAGTCLTVDAFRKELFRVLWKDNQQYSKIYVEEDNHTPDESWHGSYLPAYYPSDYRIERLNGHGEEKQAVYRNTAGESLLFCQLPLEVLETGDERILLAGGLEGWLTVEGEALLLCWNNGKFKFKLCGDVSAKELIHMAESLVLQ